MRVNPQGSPSKKLTFRVGFLLGCSLRELNPRSGLERDRAQMLDALRAVDHVLIGSAAGTPDTVDPVHAEIVAALQPDVYATDGPDPRFWTIMDESARYLSPLNWRGPCIDVGYY